MKTEDTIFTEVETDLQSEYDKLAGLIKAEQILYQIKRKEIEPLEKSIMDLFKKKDKVQERINLLHINDLSFLLAPDENAHIGSKIKSKALKEMCEEKYNGVLYGGGYTPRTNQPAFKVKLTYGKTEEIPIAVQAIKDFCQYLIPDEEGYAGFGIFEHSLSFYAVYTVLVKKDCSCAKVIHKRYSRSTEDYTGSLEDVVKYIQNNHWYHGKEDKE